MLSIILSLAAATHTEKPLPVKHAEKNPIHTAKHKAHHKVHHQAHHKVHHKVHHTPSSDESVSAKKQVEEYANTEKIVKKHVQAPDKVAKAIQRTAMRKYPEPLNVKTSTKLNDALIGAYYHNPDLHAEQMNLFAADEKTGEARSGYRPVINFESSGTLRSSTNSGTLKNAFFNQSRSHNHTVSSGLTLRQSLYSGGSTQSEVQSAEAAVLAQRAKLMVKEQEVIFNAVKAYIELWAQGTTVKVNEQNVVALTNTLKATQEKLAAGEENRTSVAQAEGKLAEGKSELELAKAEYERLAAVFTQITNVLPKDLQKPIPPQCVSNNIEEAVQNAMSFNPNFIYARFIHLSSVHDVEATEGRLRPQVSLDASVKRNIDFQRFRYPHTRNDTKGYYNSTDKSIGVSMQWPLYEGGQIRARKRGLLHNAESKRVNIESIRRQVIERLRELFAAIRAHKHNITNGHKRVSSAQIDLDGTTQEMIAGSKILLDVLNSQTRLLQARLALVDAEKKHLLAAYEYVSLMGKLTARDMTLPVNYFTPEVHYDYAANAAY